MQVGNPLGDVPETLRAVAIASAALVPVVILFTSFGGWLVAGRALAPIESIDTTLRAIEATDLSKRVDIRPADRELHGLVRTINGLLGRLERAFQDLRNFTTDASHQLPTPLSVMKSAIEFARRTPDKTEIPPLLDNLEEEVTDMSNVVADLQTLSLADNVQCEAAAPLSVPSGACRGVLGAGTCGNAGTLCVAAGTSRTR